MPIRLSDIGIDDTNFELMAEKATLTTSAIGNFVKLEKEDIISILELAK